MDFGGTGEAIDTTSGELEVSVQDLVDDWHNLSRELNWSQFGLAWVV